MVPLDIIGRGGAAAGGLGSPLAESMLMLARALASCPRASDSMASGLVAHQVRMLYLGGFVCFWGRII
jgi:hypothetical protein